MKRGPAFCRAVRISWPLLGGAWGAWLGFGAYLGLPHNADTFAGPIVLGFFIFFACAGLFTGMASGALIGGLTENLLRRLGMEIVSAVVVTTLVNALALWQIVGFVQAQFPGLRAPAAKPPASSSNRLPYRNPCAHPPPADSRERKSWDAECR